MSVSTDRLKPNALGVVGILFFVFSAQAPLTGIAGAAPLAIVLGNGAGLPMAYLAAGLIILLFSIGFVAMGRHVVHAGAFYAYIGRGLGQATGITSAAVALFAYNVIQAAMYGLYGVIVAGLFGFGPWWVWTLLTMAIVQALGALGIDIGARVLAVLVAAEFSLLGAFALVTLFTADNLTAGEVFSLDTALSGAPGVALMFAIASMFGFESTAIYGEEARDPQKTVPRATYLAVVIVSGFFAFVTWMLVAYYGPQNVVGAAGAALDAGDGAGFVFAAVGGQLGDWTGKVLEILLATSLFAGILAFHNSITRYLYSLSRDRVLHHSVGRLNRRHAPGLAGAIQTACVLLLVLPFALLGQDPVLTLFSWFSGVAVVAMMVNYFLTSVSVIVFFRREAPGSPVLTTLIAPLLGAIGIALAVWVIIANFTTLIGGTTATAAWLIGTVPAVALAGFAVAIARRRVINPHVVD
ncbi:APC family permease [Actinoplanes sichuanensis]|uniref:APC family permease n=1 Tax=Actinoplanes sichuanensis TaxID=512349 RepID=A0ABW4AAT9_9ACTN|nr:APC family permease [Actinoplanes sichuanensis]BEL08616.1 APC family permease [Actinoplanes sichuanensis]